MVYVDKLSVAVVVAVEVVAVVDGDVEEDNEDSDSAPDFDSGHSDYTVVDYMAGN